MDHEEVVAALEAQVQQLQAENAALREALSNIWRIAHNRKGQANEYVTGICEAAALKAAEETN